MLGLFTATITLSAFLLFLMQPMIAKIIMPYLGGSPSVWNTAMVFFQSLLLGGYAYVHAGTQWLTFRKQAGIHILLILASLAALPLALHIPHDVNTTDQPVYWMLSVLTLSIGLHFFLLSTSAPLLQHWFSLSGHAKAANPYPLYAASNIGSFAALLVFPTLYESLLGSGEQLYFWSWLYVAYALLVIVSFLFLMKTRAVPSAIQRVDISLQEKTAMITSGHQMLLWIALATIPSSLMLGVTTYITTDIAAVPLLWLIPLGLYLLSFIFAFGGAQRLYTACRWLYLPVITILVISWIWRFPFWSMFFLNLAGFFIIALVCHARLNALKPHPSQLTRFYLCISIGGAIGGIFNALIAPLIFNGTYEFVIMLIVAAAFHSGFRPDIPNWIVFKRLILFIATAMPLYYVWPHLENLAGEYAKADSYMPRLFILLALTLVALSLEKMRYSRVGFVSILVLLLVFYFTALQKPSLFQERNFFGQSRVQQLEKPYMRVYTHGTTRHGLQSLDPETALQVTSYYQPLKEVISALPDSVPAQSFAVLGLGVGTVQCYARDGQTFDYFEIDPLVKKIARDPNYFTYLSKCPGINNIYLGDGRLGISRQPDAHYGFIILDAYSSDSLPIHLITKEAVAIYRDKLKSGALAFHITNHHINLAPILGDIAASLSMHAAFKHFDINDKEKAEGLIHTSEWVIMSENEEWIRQMATNQGWEILDRTPARVWSDDYSNILQALSWTQPLFIGKNNKDSHLVIK